MNLPTTSGLRARLRDEAGLTLVELSIAMVVGSMVLAAVYGFMYSGNTGARVTSRIATDNRSVGHSLDDMSRLIRESQKRIHAEDYYLEITADPNNDGILDNVQYTLGTDGRLMRKIQNQAQTVTVSNVMVADNLNNRALGHPLFLYYQFKSPNGNASQDVTCAADASFSPPKDGDRLTKSSVITIDPSAESDPTSGRPAFDARTDIFLRNSAIGL